MFLLDNAAVMCFSKVLFSQNSVQKKANISSKQRSCSLKCRKYLTLRKIYKSITIRFIRDVIKVISQSYCKLGSLFFELLYF